MKLDAMVVVVLATACAHSPAAPQEATIPMTDPTLLARFAKDVACAVEKTSAVQFDETVAVDGCGRHADYVRTPDGWALDGPVATLANGEPIKFRPLMTRPQQISGRSPEYTKEALKARVQGVFIATCVLSIEGYVRDCEVTQPLPTMTEKILSALSTWRFKPVTYHGAPVSVRYVFTIRLALPRQQPGPSDAENR